MSQNGGDGDKPLCYALGERSVALRGRFLDMSQDGGDGDKPLCYALGERSVALDGRFLDVSQNGDKHLCYMRWVTAIGPFLAYAV